LVNCGASTTLTPKVIAGTTNLSADTTKYKITWLDNLNQTITKGAKNSVSVKAGSYKLIYVGSCNDTIIKKVNVVIPCTKPTTGIKTLDISTGWLPKDVNGNCMNGTVTPYTSKSDAISKWINTSFNTKLNKTVFTNCYQSELADFVYDTVKKSVIGTKVYYNSSCRPLPDGFYIGYSLQNNLSKRFDCVDIFHVSCGVIDSLDFCITNNRLGFPKTITGPMPFVKENNTPDMLPTISVHPNPNNGQFSVILDNAEVDSYRIEVYDLNGKLIHTQNMYDEKSGTIQTRLDLTSYRLAKGLYMIHAVTNDNTFIERVEIE